MTLLELLQLMRKHLPLVIVLPVVCALLTAAYAWLGMANEYTATTSIYVLTQTSDVEGGISNTDLSASQMLTNDVAKLVRSDRVMNDTAAALGMEDLSDFSISVDSDTTTRVLNVSVTGESAQEAAMVANGLAQTVNDVAIEVMNVQSVNVIDTAQAPDSPSGPRRGMYTLVAFLAGLFIAIAIIVIMDRANTRVRTPEDAQELLGVPVIGRIPKVR